MSEPLIKGLKNRILHIFARVLPGALTVRPILHRWRGVKIGRGVWIGYDAIIETSYPELVQIEDGAGIGIRSMLIAHFRGMGGIIIESEASIGPGAIILPNVRIGKGAVVTAGSVVTRSVPPMTIVQGNPARPIAKCGESLKRGVSMKEFLRHVKPLSHKGNAE